jgi:hypothetical protein
MRVLFALLAALCATPAFAAGICEGFGPQAPRDLFQRQGVNAVAFAPAPAASELNLCNIHLHAQAEHRGPGFTILASGGHSGGYRCDDTSDLTPAQLAATATGGSGHGDTTGHGTGMAGVAPGETIEVHWVYSSCDVFPGPTLASCLAPGACINPQLRFEAQVFLVVNDPAALDFADFDYALPDGAQPIVYAGSTTGPKFSEATCSPFQVTWSVRPGCLRVDIGSLDRWATQNPFYENHAHGVRELVTNPVLLAPIR